MTPPPAAAANRKAGAAAASTGPVRSLMGVVDRARTDQTRRVIVRFQTRHPKYGKFVNKRTILAVHDEDNTSGKGDKVEIVPCRPMSRTKRWRLLRVVEKATETGTFHETE